MISRYDVAGFFIGFCFVITILLNTKAITANIVITTKMQAPTPALNKESAIEKLLIGINSIRSIAILVIFLCMISRFH